MTATLNRLGSGAGAGIYYTNDSARESKPRNRDEYYALDGGGVWWSSGQTVVRHDAPIDLKSFRELCAGFDPRTGTALVRGAGPGHWAGHDITFTPGKSVSLLWAAGTAQQRETIEAIHRAAVDDVLRVIEREGLVLVRSGAGGRHQAPPIDMIIARFQHFTTREGDPNIHTHCVIMNVAAPKATSARYKATTHLTIDPKGVVVQQLMLGAAYRSAMAERLKALGFAFRSAGRGQWEIAGVPQELIEIFSKRSHQVEERVGRGATAAQKQIAALETRGSKDLIPTGDELEALWRADLAAYAIDPWSAGLTPTPQRAAEIATTLAPQAGHELDPPDVEGTTPVAIAASTLFRHQNVITRKALLQEALIQAGLRGIGIAAVYDELARFEADDVLLRLGPTHEKGQLWTTPSIARIEAQMLQDAGRALQRAWFDEQAVAAALQHADHLSAEQQDAVHRAVSQDAISIIEAGAGTGKTTAAQAIVEAARRSGLTVIGLAPSWVAADELSKSTGIDARAVAKWRADAKGQAPTLNEKTLLLVDEAGMVSMRDMAAIIGAARQSQSKVVLMGDSRQLQSVPGGSALRAITEMVRQNAVMEAVRRQTVDWQRAAWVLMARGDAEAGLRAYAQNGHVEMVAGTAAAMRHVVDTWHRLRADYGDDVLIMTRRNADAALLNHAIRADLRAAGRIVGDDVVLASINRENEAASLPLAMGDVVRFSETLPDLRIRNGNRGTIEAVRADRGGDATLRIRLEEGRVVDCSWQDLARRRPGQPQGPPRVVHAYAGTAYAAQGRTAAASVHYIGAATESREIYVALTRHRHDVRIVVERERLDAACRQRQTDHRLPPTAAAIEEHLFKEASQYSEKANVVDHVADRQRFIMTGVVTREEERPDRSLSRLMQAARALRETLRAFMLDEASVPIWRLVDDGRRLAPPLFGPLQQAIARLRNFHARPPSRTIDPDRGVER